jgi:CheY-like chemotaxis protein
MGAAEALLEGIYGDLNNEQRRTVSDIYATSEEVLALVRDVLDLSRIRFGEVELVMEQVNLPQMIHDLVHLPNYRRGKKSLTWNFQVSNTAINIVGDAQRIRQILVNLFDTAVRQSHDNGVITIRLDADSAQRVVRLSVIDSGDGIPEHRRARIFEPFAHSEDASDNDQTASGLSLAIVQKIVDLHGGIIRLDSEVGRGTSFHVTLPWNDDYFSRKRSSISDRRSGVPTDSDLGAGTASSDRPENTMLFIVDDNPMQCQLLESFAKKSGFTVLSFLRGAECLRMLDEVWPDIMIVDIQMPEMDGLSLIERVREVEAQKNVEVAIIALTALSMPGDREACLAAGASRFLTKPISYREFMQELQEHIGL